ncbi:FMN-binding negative transcriptional regulator [Chitinophaga sancti]|uniref:FMN-binding negative transcriptional regulator n=2 Tax=Chitinophaga sancti TaxID=1004 RepID=A0ABZ0XLF0_9BACT|nr:FMN-binding negative transcriptional regulator [Chitinophaga sancti]WQD62914.1 FMN-binding negative transcriptional regulator [Chitinophaga sancti]WQG91462.1 FMN-binding negative transcriptional regulator [Chitinophaga sancti]
MYIPHDNLMDNPAEILSFIQRYSFGTLVTNIEGIPVATHLPFHAKMKDGQLILTTHIAKANKQWQGITDQQNLVIFSEPHAYISPSNYDSRQSVPTWNYLSVHAYGKANIIDDKEAVMALLESAIEDYEPAYMAQWNELPEAFKYKMANGIVAFEIAVTTLQGKKKLSQNKTDEERKRIIESLKKSGDTNMSQLGEYMEGKK